MDRSDKDINRNKRSEKQSTAISNCVDHSFPIAQSHLAVRADESVGAASTYDSHELMRLRHRAANTEQGRLSNNRIPSEGTGNNLYIETQNDSLHTQHAAAVGMSSDIGPFTVPVMQLNTGIRNLSHLLLSPRGLPSQYQMQLEQNILHQGQMIERQRQQHEAAVSVTDLLLRNQQQVVNAAALVLRQQNQAIDRLRQEALIIESLRQGQLRSVLTSTAMIPTDRNMPFNLPPGVRDSFALNQDYYQHIYPETANPSQHLYVSISTSSSRHQEQQYPSALRDGFQMIPSQTLISSVPQNVSTVNTSNDINAAAAAASNAARNLPKASLPVLLGLLDNNLRMLTDHQLLLRQQIEIFEADIEDATTHMRGRNKPVLIGQVGIRCKHCAHVSVPQRQKGSTYFPSTKMGIYQAVQNMSAVHITNGLCNYMPNRIKNQFVNIMNNRQSSVACTRPTGSIGRQYWARSASNLGLIDTEEHGIRFICNWPYDENTGSNG